MKFHLILITALLVPTFLCAQKSEELIGLWRCDSQKTLRSMSAFSKSKYDSMSSRTKSSIETRIGKRSYNFSEPGVTINFGLDGTANQVIGEWSYTEGDLLTITVHGQSKKYKVAWESNDRIQLIDREAINKSVFGIMYLNRGK